jgi:branched-chain amino acid transport system permease protein
MFNYFFQQVANGLALGSIYALVAIGFTMVYGILFFINMPHGDMMMVGTYVALGLFLGGMPFIGIVIGGIIFTALLGMAIELLAYRRLRKARRLAPLLSAVGVSYTLSNGIQVTAGPMPKPFPKPFSGEIILSGVTIPAVIVITVVTTALLALVLELFIHKTKIGTAIRAASQDLPITALMGISINKIISLTFAISGSMSVVAGIMLGWRYGSVSPTIGFAFMMKAFAACVLGGIGNIRGAIVGSLILGLAEVFAVAYISSAYRDAIAFIVLIATLLIRPSGILGGRTDVAV